jgi:hypothetical protein
MNIDPAALGPGKHVTGAMALAVLEQYSHVFIIMLMHRLGVEEVLIGDADCEAMQLMPEGVSLAVIPEAAGLRLKIISRDELANMIKRDPTLAFKSKMPDGKL